MSRHQAPLVVVAEDDPDDTFLLKEAWGLVAAERELRFVQDGEELLSSLRDGAAAPGLILLDLNMPRKDGRQALREMKADPQLRRIPVVAFSTSRAEKDIALVYELGANSYIVKPPSFDALVDLLRSLEGYWFGSVQLPPPRE